MTQPRSNAQKRPWRQRLAGWLSLRPARLWYRRNRRETLLALLLVMFVFVYLAPSIFVNVGSGHAGVLWRRFAGGTDVDNVFGEGIKVIYPWNRMFVYNVRLQKRDQTYYAISKDGLQVALTITFRYYPIFSSLGYMHKHLGPRYVEVLLVPEIGSMVRHEVSRISSFDVYGPQREALQHRIYGSIVAAMNHNQIAAPGKARGVLDTRAPGFEQEVDDFRVDQLEVNYVELTDILIREVKLPDRVRDAIERKMEQDQLAQEYQYRLARERLESQRKAIEAVGIRLFQNIVQAGISENYLKWRGIEATLHLATSSNAKVVIIGSGENGLPLILNTADANPAVGASGLGLAGLSDSLDATPPDLASPFDSESVGLVVPGAKPAAPAFGADAAAGAPDRELAAGTSAPGSLPDALSEEPPLSPLLSPVIGIQKAPEIWSQIEGIFSGMLGPGHGWIPEHREDQGEGVSSGDERHAGETPAEGVRKTPGH